jgi:hypothetical protein
VSWPPPESGFHFSKSGAAPDWRAIFLLKKNLAMALDLCPTGARMKNQKRRQGNPGRRANCLN